MKPYLDLVKHVLENGVLKKIVQELILLCHLVIIIK